MRSSYNNADVIFIKIPCVFYESVYSRPLWNRQRIVMSLNCFGLGKWNPNSVLCVFYTPRRMKSSVTVWYEILCIIRDKSVDIIRAENININYFAKLISAKNDWYNWYVSDVNYNNCGTRLYLYIIYNCSYFIIASVYRLTVSRVINRRKAELLVCDYAPNRCPPELWVNYIHWRVIQISSRLHRESVIYFAFVTEA